MELSNFDPAAFLRDYWQKRPVVLRAAWDGWNNPLEPDELAGLACEPGVESRLVTGSGQTWQLEHGPFPASRFGALGAAPWTLLVQAVDHHVPPVAALLRPFRFIPNWRVDDVMVSYAVDGGGVGPHFDQYDVFLVQGLGQRRWRLGAMCDEDTPLQPHAELRLLADFQPTAEYVLDPGDILYVPPRIAHDGVAVGDDCMTYSIGYRAPSQAELVAAWAEDAVAALGDDQRYADPDLQLAANPGEITAAALARLQAMIAERLMDRAAFADWFGRYGTRPKNSDIDWRPDAAPTASEVRKALTEGAVIVRNPASRFAFITGSETSVTLFVDEEAYQCAGPAAALAERICADDTVALPPAQTPSQAVVDLLTQLLARGTVALGG